MAIKEVQGTPNRPGRKGYVTTTFTGKDVRKARGLLDKQAKESAEKINAEKATYRNVMRNHRGQVKTVDDQGAQQIEVMMKAQSNRRFYPRGAPATRPTFTMPGYFKKMPDGTRKLVREGEEGY